MKRSGRLQSDPEKLREWRRRSKGLRARSSKKAAQQRRYRSLVADVPRCEAGPGLAAVGVLVCNGRNQHAHHRRRQGRGGADTRENVVAICNPCHTWVHDHPAQARQLGLLVFEGDPEWVRLGRGAR